MRRVASPSRDDPLVRRASEGLGGPVGDHATPHPWWTPVRVVLAVTCVAFLLAMAQKAPCVADGWNSSDLRYAKMCYSDVPYLYTGRGFAELQVPYTDSGGRYPVLEYPVLIGYFAFGAAFLTHALAGFPDLGPRLASPVGELWSRAGVQAEIGLYFAVTAVLLGLAALAAGWLLAGASPGRPWDAMAFAASPALVLTGLVNWDLLAVVAVAGALWAWARDRPLLTGVLIGLGTAAKLYPLFLLGGVLVLCLRRLRGASGWRHALRPFFVAAAAAVAAWVAVNAPALLVDADQWLGFWTFNSDRGADLGSLWLVWQQMGHTVTPELINRVSWVFFVAVCAGVLVLGLRARRTPTLAELGFLVVAGFLLVNKVYSPQYVLWLLPLAVLARPRWRDLLIWQAGEVFYFGAVWLYLGGFTAAGASGEPDRVYWLAIVVRVACEVYLVVRVARDLLRPDEPGYADADVGTPQSCVHSPPSR